MAYDVTNKSTTAVSFRNPRITIPVGETRRLDYYPKGITNEMLAGVSIVHVAGTPEGDFQMDPEDVQKSLSKAVALTFSATPAVDLSLGSLFSMTLTGNVTGVAAPTNAKEGTFFTVSLVQDATGGRTVAWNAAYKFPVAWSNTGNTANTKTTITFRYVNGYAWAIGQNAWVA